MGYCDMDTFKHWATHRLYDYDYYDEAGGHAGVQSRVRSLPDTQLQARAQPLLDCFMEEDHVVEVIVVLLGLAIRLGKDRIEDWNLEEAIKLAEQAVSDGLDYDLGGMLVE